MPDTRQTISDLIDQWVRQAEQAAQPGAQLVKREAPRFMPWPVPIQLRINGDTLDAGGRDICTGGIGFSCRYAFPRDEKLEFRAVGNTVWIPIIVRHCTACLASFTIGARFILK